MSQSVGHAMNTMHNKKGCLIVSEGRGQTGRIKAFFEGSSEQILQICETGQVDRIRLKNKAVQHSSLFLAGVDWVSSTAALPSFTAVGLLWFEGVKNYLTAPGTWLSLVVMTLSVICFPV